MLKAAVAVSVGCVPPGAPVEVAYWKRVVHWLEVAPLESIQEERMSARVSRVACGTMPLPAGVVERAMWSSPSVVVLRFAPWML